MTTQNNVGQRDERRTIDATAAARLLGVHPRTLIVEIDAGRFPGGIRIGTRRVVSRAVLERLLAGSPLDVASDAKAAPSERGVR